MHTGLNYGLTNLLNFQIIPEWKWNARGRASGFRLSSSSLVWKPPTLRGSSHEAYNLDLDLMIVKGWWAGA